MTDPAPHDETSTETSTEVTIRRAPKLSVFIVLGALAGFLATLILTSLFKPDPSVGFAASLGYFSLFGVPIGIVIGATVGLLLDLRSRRRARTVTMEREIVASDAEPTPDDPE